MDKKEIIKKFMERGILLSQGEVEKINESNYLEILRKHEGVEAKKEISKQEPVVEVIKFTKKTKMTPKDFVGYYSKKYEEIKNLLVKKLNAISINKTKELISTSNIIGVVKEKTQNGFLLEDQTGTIEIISSKEPPIGDVFAVVGSSREGKFLEKEIIYPDIPLIHKPHSVDVDFSLKNINPLPNPAHIEIKKGNDEGFVLVYKTTEKITEEDAIELLKKRHLSPKRDEICSDGKDGDPFLIEPIPDVFLILSNEEFTKNYKGVSIISTKNKEAKINLMTKGLKT